MKLNPDCIRDVMLELEESLSISKTGHLFRFSTMPVDALASCVSKKYGYSSSDIVYSSLQLFMGGYIATNGNSPICDEFNLLNLGEIVYITPKGHELISSIHDKETWTGKISPVLNKLGGVSLSVIEAVSKGFANALVDRLMLNSQEQLQS